MWYSLPFVWPAHNQTVWIRRFFYGDPFIATYNSVGDAFKTPDNHIINWWFISRWRAL